MPILARWTFQALLLYNLVELEMTWLHGMQTNVPAAHKLKALPAYNCCWVVLRTQILRADEEAVDTSRATALEDLKKLPAQTCQYRG